MYWVSRKGRRKKNLEDMRPVFITFARDLSRIYEKNKDILKNSILGGMDNFIHVTDVPMPLLITQVENFLKKISNEVQLNAA